LTPQNPVVSLHKVSVTLGWKRVLEGIDLDLRSGEVVGLIGPGGSGKTQLIRVLSTLVVPWKGEVRLFGRRVLSINRKLLREVRKRIGLQFQNFALFDFLDVRHNVGFSLEHSGRLGSEEITARVDTALSQVGLKDFADAWPSELSGGMRRRVAIARVIASQPEMAIFDDPVAGLDPVNSAKNMLLLEEYARSSGSLVVIATHDMERLLPVCTRVVALFGGKILFDGPVSGVPLAESSQVRDFVAAGTEAVSDPDPSRPASPSRGGAA